MSKVRRRNTAKKIPSIPRENPNEINEQYRRVLDMQEHAQFLAGASKKITADAIPKMLLQTQKVARQNYILLSLIDDDVSLKSILSLQDILNSFSAKVPYFFTVVGEPQLGQNVSQFIKIVYENPEDFANAILKYFHNNRSKYQLFASMLFPSMCGFFVAKEHLSFAYSVLRQIIELGKTDFASPLITSFYMSSILFINVFWEKFMNAVNEPRTKPNFRQLHDILIHTLNSTVKYLSPLHTSLAMDMLTTDPRTFNKIFFLKFLLNSFDSFTSWNPAMQSSRVSKNDLMKLFSFIDNNINSTSFDDLTTAFYSNASSFGEPTSFVKFTNKGAIPYIFSPMEIVLLLDVIGLMNAFNGKTYDLRRVKDPSRLESFMPGQLDIYFPVPPPDKVRAVVFVESINPPPQPSAETARNWNAIQNHCAKLGLDPLKISIENAVEDPTDSMESRRSKQAISSKVTEELKKYAMLDTAARLYKNMKAFETYLVRGQQQQNLDDLELRLQHFGDIMLRSVYSRYSSSLSTTSNAFTSVAAIESISFNEADVETNNMLLKLVQNRSKIEDVARDVRPKRRSGDRMAFSTYIEERSARLDQLARTLDRLDERSLGERAMIIADVVDILQSICNEVAPGNDAWLLPLFFEVLSRSRATSFLHTFLCVGRFRRQNERTFSSLPMWVLRPWSKIAELMAGFVNKRDKKGRLIIEEEYVEMVNKFVLK